MNPLATRIFLAALLCSVPVLHAAFPATAPASTQAARPGELPPRLLDAIANRDLAAFKRHLPPDFPINTTDANGDTLLTTAAANGATDIGLALLAAGADPHIHNKQDGTALSNAAIGGSPKLVQALLKAGAKVPDDPVSIAAAGSPEQIRDLVAKDHALLTKTWYFSGTSDDETLIQIAACHGNAPVIRELAALGADPKFENREGFTPLIHAAAWGHLEAVKELLALDNRIDHPNKYGWTPLNDAAHEGHLDIVKLLLSRGAQYDIFSAAALDDVPRIKELLKEDPKLLEKRIGFDTPLAWACATNKAQAAEYLLKAGADINAHEPCYTGNAPLQHAAWRGHAGIVKLLVAHKPNLEIGANDDPYGTALHIAAHRGNLEIVKLLVEAGANIESVSNSPQTPLCFAAGQGQVEIVAYLLDHHAKPDAALAPAVHNSETAVARLLLAAINAAQKNDAAAKPDLAASLAAAASKGNLQLAQILLDAGADPETPGDTGMGDLTPLHAAIRECKKENFETYRKIIDLLLEKGAKIENASHGQTPLQSAALFAQCPELVKYLLKKGADPAATDGRGQTVLHYACMSPNKEIIALLLEKKINVNAADNDGTVPAHHLLLRQTPAAAECMDLLAAHGMTPDAFVYAQLGNAKKVMAAVREDPGVLKKRAAGQSLLSIAIQKENLELVKNLVEAGAEIEPANESSALANASWGGNLKIMQYFIDQGADVNLPGEYQQRPLYNAAMNNKADAIKLLLKADANPELTTAYGITPLRHAASEGHMEAVKALVEGGASVDAASSDGTTALYGAVQYGHADVALYLLDKGAIPNDSHHAYGPFLHEAASSGNVPLFQALLKKGLDINHLNERGDSALDWVQKTQHPDMFKAVKDAGGLPGQEILKTIPALVAQLDNENFAVRNAADKSLRNLGPATVRALKEALQSATDPESQSRLSAIIKSLEPQKQNP